MIGIRSEDWNHWKDTAVANTADPSGVPQLIAQVEALFQEALSESMPEVPASAPPVQRDASTQVYTVDGMFVSSYVLRRNLAERSAMGLSRHVGRLANQVQRMGTDVIRLLESVATHQYSATAFTGEHHSTVSPDKSGGDHHDEIDETPRIDHGTEHLVDSLSDATVRAACAACRPWREWMKENTERVQRDDLTEARHCLAKILAARTLSVRYRRPAIPHSQYPGPFLCRRCRTDGRLQIQYSREKRKLLSGVPLAVESAYPLGSCRPRHGLPVNVNSKQRVLPPSQRTATTPQLPSVWKDARPS